MQKQDIARARTTQDLERKYKFGESFAEAFGLARDAKDAAEKAQQAADEAKNAASGVDTKLTQEEIFKRLTNDGEVQGLYRQDGQIYINAAYLVTGILRSKNGDTFYLDLDNGVLKMQATEFSVSGKTVDDIAQEKADSALSSANTYADSAAQNAVNAQTQADIFNKLTNNATAQGVFIKDGQLYINASYLATGVLSSKNGTTFYLDLDNGILKMEASEFSVSGKTVDAIAQEKANTAESNAKSYASSAANTAESNAKDYADTAAGNAVSQQTQQDIFKKLTNNGEDQGLYLEGGKVYINAQYILSGSFTSTASVFLEPGLEEFETIKAHILGTATIPSSNKTKYDFNNDGDVTITDLLLCRKAMLGQSSLASWSKAVKSTVTVTLDASTPTRAIKITGTNMWGRAVEIYMGVDGANIGVVPGNLAVGGKFSVGGAVQFETNANNEATLSIGTTGTPKKISWKANGDGTFTLIGQ